MGIEPLVAVFKGAATVNSVRKLLTDKDAATQAARAIAEVSDRGAKRLYLEAATLPPAEQVAALEQVALLLEMATEAADTGVRPWYRKLLNFTYRPGVIEAEIHRLMWLAALYQLLGHREKAGNRVNSIREKLAELEVSLASALLWEMITFTQLTRGGPGREVLARFEERVERRHNARLSGLRALCDRLDQATASSA